MHVIRVSICVCSYHVRYATVYYSTMIIEQGKLLLHAVLCSESSLQVWNSFLYSVVHACFNLFRVLNVRFTYVIYVSMSLPVVHIVVFVFLFVLFCKTLAWVLLGLRSVVQLACQH